MLRVPIGTALSQNRIPPPDQIHRITSVLEAAIDCGIYAIVDWHSHERSTAEAAFVLGEIAARYGDIPNLLYEPWNEPLDHHGWLDCIKPHHEQVAARIRDSAPGAAIIAGTRDYCQRVDEAAEDPLQIENVLYALHFYAASHREGLRIRARAALSRNLPLIVSEWGTCEANGGGVIDFDESERWWEFMESHAISSAYWAISDSDESSAALRTNALPQGKWARRDLSSSGRYIRRKLRAAGRLSTRRY